MTSTYNYVRNRRNPPKKTKDGKYVSKTQQYWAYEKMKDRCYNPNNNMYHVYGAKGIKVCDRWMQSYQNFIDDMGERPTGMTLDRINPEGNYCPENCRWATDHEQNRNKTNTVKFSYKGRDQILPDWAKELNIRISTLVNRLYISKWPVEKAFETPQKEYIPRYVAKKSISKEEFQFEKK